MNCLLSEQYKNFKRLLEVLLAEETMLALWNRENLSIENLWTVMHGDNFELSLGFFSAGEFREVPGSFLIDSSPLVAIGSE